MTVSQDVVAGQMTVGVVVGLEVVDVHQGHAVAVAVAQNTRFEENKVLFQGPSVTQAGEGVSAGDGYEFVIEPLQLGLLSGQLAMQRCDPGGGDQAGLEFVGVEGLDQKVVGAGRHPFEDLGLGPLTGDHDEVGVAERMPGPNSAAQLQPAHARHHPIADDRVGQPRREDVPRLGTVGHRAAFMTELLECGLNDEP